MTSGGFKGQDDSRFNINWSELKVPDVKLGWELCRTSISQHFFDGKKVVIPVPMLPEAQKFGLLTCFTTPNVELDPQLSQDFEIQGKFHDLFCGFAPDEKKAMMSNVFPQKEDYETKLEAYCFQNSDGSKSVEVDFTNLSSVKVDLLDFHQKQFILDMDLLKMGDKRDLYVINEVIYADALYCKVTVDGQNVHERVRCHQYQCCKMPVAFCYKKFKIFTTGVVLLEDE